MKVLITGPSGSGKTYLSEQLKKLGVNAVDADAIHGLSSWYDTNDNKVAYPKDAGREFFANHSFLWDKTFLSNYLADKHDIYLFGLSGNIFDMLDLFDKSYYLDIPGEVINARLQHPSRQNPMGSTQFQRTNAIKWAQKLRLKAKRAGLVFINGELSANKIIDLIKG